MQQMLVLLLNIVTAAEAFAMWYRLAATEDDYICPLGCRRHGPTWFLRMGGGIYTLIQWLKWSERGRDWGGQAVKSGYCMVWAISFQVKQSIEKYSTCFNWRNV